MKKIFLIGLISMGLFACKKDNGYQPSPLNKEDKSSLQFQSNGTAADVGQDSTQVDNPGDFTDPTRPIFGGGVGSGSGKP